MDLGEGLGENKTISYAGQKAGRNEEWSRDQSRDLNIARSSSINLLECAATITNVLLELQTLYLYKMSKQRVELESEGTRILLWWAIMEAWSKLRC